MLAEENYHKEYYKKNKNKSKISFQKWYSNPENKEKMKVYMRNYMRKKKGTKKENFRINEEDKLHSESYLKAIEKKKTKKSMTKLCGAICCGIKEPEEPTYNEMVITTRLKRERRFIQKIDSKEKLIERLAKENIKLIEELIVIKKYLQLKGIELPD